jgi:ubiquinone/menaquinone biosynthesis C-methylase UbiE
MGFATDQPTLAYYERRAHEYDDWWTGTGLFAELERPGWEEETRRLVDTITALPPGRTLDVACGTGFLTRHLRGLVVGLDQSPSVVAIAQSRLPEGLALVGNALALPFADGSFDRLFTAHFYGHLVAEERPRFLSEARRVAGELVVVDSALQPGAEPQQWQERVLSDGSRHRIFKRFLNPEQLARELDGEILFSGRWFVAATSKTPR